jgi:glycosyltransferase family protein
MLNKIKLKIKNMLPDRVIYVYRIFLVMPNFFKALKKKHISGREITFLSDLETIRMITEEGYSLSRFGDGEFQWMLGKGKQYFQDGSKELQERLIQVFSEKTDKLLVGIPKGIFDSRKCNLQAKIYWEMVNRSYMSEILNMRRDTFTFSDASITRPYIDYISRKESAKRFENLKKIWDGRDILIVEGKGTKLGVGSDLLSNSRSISRIICPSKNAFEKIDLIESAIIEQSSRDKKMILVALGPTATIIAFDLSRLGYQVIDIGHIDVEYIWFLRHDVYKKPIEGKSVNETGDISFSSVYDKENDYINSIIQTIE